MRTVCLVLLLLAACNEKQGDTACLHPSAVAASPATRARQDRIWEGLDRFVGEVTFYV